MRPERIEALWIPHARYHGPSPNGPRSRSARSREGWQRRQDGQDQDRYTLCVSRRGEPAAIISRKGLRS